MLNRKNRLWFVVWHPRARNRSRAPADNLRAQSAEELIEIVHSFLTWRGGVLPFRTCLALSVADRRVQDPALAADQDRGPRGRGRRSHPPLAAHRLSGRRHLQAARGSLRRCGALRHAAISPHRNSLCNLQPLPPSNADQHPSRCQGPTSLRVKKAPDTLHRPPVVNTSGYATEKAASIATSASSRVALRVEHSWVAIGQRSRHRSWVMQTFALKSAIELTERTFSPAIRIESRGNSLLAVCQGCFSVTIGVSTRRGSETYSIAPSAWRRGDAAPAYAAVEERRDQASSRNARFKHITKYQRGANDKKSAKDEKSERESQKICKAPAKKSE